MPELFTNAGGISLVSGTRKRIISTRRARCSSEWFTPGDGLDGARSPAVFPSGRGDSRRDNVKLLGLEDRCAGGGEDEGEEGNEGVEDHRDGQMREY